MTRQIYRASSYQDRPQREEVSIRDKAVWNDDELGFRLVVDTDADRVLRGGGWYYSARFARVADRYRFDPAYRDNNLGFRLVRDGEEA